MAGTFDVAGRLAEGQPAVDDFARYAEACQALGTCGHGLTGRLEQAYTTEAGLDLHALDADHAALRAAVVAVREAQQVQDAQLNALSAAWSGAGADAAADVLHRHSAASTQAVTALSAAAEQVGALRDELWRIVDAKVAAAEEVDARTDGVRGEWRAAAETVNTGVGDRSTASELVDAQVAPFVEQDVRAEWVAAMEAATEAICRCFDNATTAVRSEAPMGFPDPGAVAPVAAPPLPAVTEPAAATAPPAMPPTAAMPSAGAMPDMGSGLGGLSGLSGLGQQLGEMISGLVPTVGDALGELPEPEEPEEPELDDDTDEEADDTDEAEDEDAEVEDEEAAEPEGEGDEVGEEGEVLEEGVTEPVVTATEPPIDEPAPEPPAPTPAPAAPLAAPVAPPPDPASATPCEIAADEVPQVGE
ncbi:hypothetical protein [Mycolicibacterium litorale]|uniref:Uncharacterized protein n=1 Tax=Mycolicibacterium litorale TaxID=758802 RepID=A0AAD1IKG7_9MYCO|nr:hypothetical protein [Mycolicibacterium litorale]MCV7416250.1 hypothetical protein [Mycolicibacterium litorale]TDY09501.1 hypothetical protein BCL50_1594 [Mycolicibacterium litorale]BBY17447.1 hypothetical protein MLIT_30390 [Mycolicibacterium litorale]